MSLLPGLFSCRLSGRGSAHTRATLPPSHRHPPADTRHRPFDRGWQAASSHAWATCYQQAQSMHMPVALMPVALGPMGACRSCDQGCSSFCCSPCPSACPYRPSPTCCSCNQCCSPLASDAIVRQVYLRLGLGLGSGSG